MRPTLGFVTKRLQRYTISHNKFPKLFRANWWGGFLTARALGG